MEKSHARKTSRLVTEGFAVTIEKEIGRVKFNEGTLQPHEAAFLLISNAGEDGTFRFPGPKEGVTVTVTVDTSDRYRDGQTD